MSAVTALDALHIARLAWERSQPQYVLDLYPEPGLSEAPQNSPGPEAAGEPAGLAEPQRLTSGAEPHRTPGDELTPVATTVPPANPLAGGSAPTSPAEETGDAPPPATEARKTPLSESPASAGTTPANNGGSAASSPQKPRGAPAEGV